MGFISTTTLTQQAIMSIVNMNHAKRWRNLEVRIFFKKSYDLCILSDFQLFRVSSYLPETLQDDLLDNYLLNGVRNCLDFLSSFINNFIVKN